MFPHGPQSPHVLPPGPNAPNPHHLFIDAHMFYIGLKMRAFLGSELLLFFAGGRLNKL